MINTIFRYRYNHIKNRSYRKHSWVYRLIPGTHNLGSTKKHPETIEAPPKMNTNTPIVVNLTALEDHTMECVVAYVPGPNNTAVLTVSNADYCNQVLHGEMTNTTGDRRSNATRAFHILEDWMRETFPRRNRCERCGIATTGRCYNCLDCEAILYCSVRCRQKDYNRHHQPHQTRQCAGHVDPNMFRYRTTNAAHALVIIRAVAVTVGINV